MLLIRLNALVFASNMNNMLVSGYQGFCLCKSCFSGTLRIILTFPPTPIYLSLFPTPLSLSQIYVCCVHVSTCYQSSVQTFCLWPEADSLPLPRNTAALRSIFLIREYHRGKGKTVCDTTVLRYRSF